MKTLVTYFSATGQTRRVAQEIAKRCGGDLDPICMAQQVDSRWASWRFRWHALVRAAPSIKKPSRNPALYDLVIIGAPLSRFGVAPPVRSYALLYASRFKDVAFFCAEGNVDEASGFAELSKLCGRRPIATFAVARKHLPVAAHIKELVDFLDSIRAR